MARKRKPLADDAINPLAGTRTYKRTRKSKSQSEPIQLTSLPPELIDSILFHVLDPTANVERGLDRGEHWNTLFLSPILQTCTSLREKGFATIAKGCLWVSIPLTSDDIMYDGIKWPLDTFPFLRKVFRDYIRSYQPPRIEICYEDPRQTPPRPEVMYDKMMFMPYDCGSFQRLLYMIMRCTLYSRGPWYNTSIRLPPISSFQYERAITEEIVPSLYLAQQLGGDFAITNDRTPPVALFVQDSGEGVAAPHVLTLLRAIMKHVILLDTSDLREEAAFWLLYSGTQLELLGTDILLPRAEDWAQGETDEIMPFTSTDINVRWRNAMGNEIRTSVHKLEYRACLGYLELFQRYGRRFYEIHDEELSEDEVRWRYEDHRYPIFGLSERERAQVHHMRAISKYVEHGACQKWEEFFNRGVELKDRRVFGNDAVVRIYHMGKCIAECLQQLEIAIALDPTNEDFEKLLDQICCDADIQRVRGTQEHERKERLIRHHQFRHKHTFELQAGVAQQAGFSVWTGDMAMLRHWGGENALRYLPLAQKRLSDDQWRMLNESQTE